jgi:taurine dioxygenase
MTELTVRRANPRVGAEVEGLKPRIPLDDETIRQLRAAFDDRGLLVFRDLDIDEDFQRHLVYALIDDEPRSPEDRYVLLVSNKEEGAAAPYGRLLFHSDNMWARTPQPAISLYGLSVEPPGAPTLFAGMARVGHPLR